MTDRILEATVSAVLVLGAAVVGGITAMGVDQATGHAGLAMLAALASALLLVPAAYTFIHHR